MPQTDRFLIFLRDGFVLAAAIGLVCALVTILARRKRAREVEQASRQTGDIERGSPYSLETHTERSLPAENVGLSEMEQYELPRRGLDEPETNQLMNGPLEDAEEGRTSATCPAGDLPAHEREIDGLPLAVEPVPVTDHTEPEKENAVSNLVVPPTDFIDETTAKLKPTGVVGEEGRSVPTAAIAVPEPIDEVQTTINGEKTETGEVGLATQMVEAVNQTDVEEVAEEAEGFDVEYGERTATDGTPARYRAPALGPRTQRRRGSSSAAKQEDRDQSLELRVWAVSDRHGFCRFHIVARRQPGWPSQIEVHSGRRTAVFSEVADDWFQVAELPDLPRIMERGLKLSGTTGEGTEVRWELRGRDLYALGELHGISGFVSTTRLSIGGKQIVLCREDRATEVRAILVEAGCDGAQARDRDFGAPPGWVFFGPVNPSRSVPQVPGDDVLNLIRPIPDLEIRLEGGLWLRDSSWIAGYPPKIHIAGDLPLGAEVMIDGEAAEEREPRVYVTGGSERSGSHAVWCAGKSASYEICEPDVRWDEWKADGFSRRVSGAVVAGAGNAHEIVASVPTSNPVLIGANAGEVFRCDKRPGKQWTGLVPFAVCWALPEDALHCDRRLRRVLLVKPIAPVHSVVWKYRKKSASGSILQWCHAIRDCQRKGLALSPADEASEQLWREYKREARAVWRAAR